MLFTTSPAIYESQVAQKTNAFLINVNGEDLYVYSWRGGGSGATTLAYQIHIYVSKWSKI